MENLEKYVVRDVSTLHAAGVLCYESHTHCVTFFVKMLKAFFSFFLSSLFPSGEAPTSPEPDE